MTAPVNLPNNPTVPIKVVRPTKPKSILRRMARTWQGRVGMLLGAFILALIFLGPFFAPYDPQALAVGSPLEGPSAKHWLGTDNLGRDVLSRLMNGGVNIILLPVIIVLLSFLIGGVPGIIAGYKRGAFDTIVTRVFDILLTLPPLLVVMIIIASFGNNPIVLVVSVSLVFAPRVGRLARASTHQVVVRDYIQAAEARGESLGSVLFREVMPNIAGPMIADTALRLTYAVVFVASLNFLGLGEQPPSSDWGLAVSAGREYVMAQPWAVVAPAAAIAVLSLSINLVAEALTREVVRTPEGASL